MNNFSELKVGNTIELSNGERFIVDKIYEGNYVDMTAVEEYSPSLGMNWHETFFSIKLDEFKIIET